MDLETLDFSIHWSYNKGEGIIACFIDRILPYINQVNDGALREWLQRGIAIHTAGLSIVSLSV